jgi:hypothetical protein
MDTALDEVCERCGAAMIVALSDDEGLCFACLLDAASTDNVEPRQGLQEPPGAPYERSLGPRASVITMRSAALL